MTTRTTTTTRAPARRTTKTAARTTTARKTAKKATAKKATAKKATTKKTTARKTATKKATARKTTARKATARKTTARKTGRRAVASGAAKIRVRMYRVGFGDFFLLTVPGNDGPAHILIDCGVHAADIKSMGACVEDLARETGGRLALVILTHYHADHMSGFAAHYDTFADFEHIGAVWITNRLDPAHKSGLAFTSTLSALAEQLQLRLAARAASPHNDQALAKVENAIGYRLGAAAGGRSNDKALMLLTKGFKCKPPVHYYQAGDVPFLPPELDGAIGAEIIGPAPLDSNGDFSASDNKRAQYLAAVADEGLAGADPLRAFEKAWPASASDYPPEAFAEFEAGPGGPAKLEALLHAMQPDMLAATADKIDGTLNNQSLVILFTCRGKKLLFVGDAQWGNWAYWLFGRKVAGDPPELSARAKEILGSIDFYKVGHHGSTNATPIPAVAALNQGCAAMCSTATGAYGNSDKGTEVPRSALMSGLAKRIGNRLVRSDWVAAAGTAPDPEARAGLAKLPAGFSTPEELFIDFNL